VFDVAVWYSEYVVWWFYVLVYLTDGILCHCQCIHEWVQCFSMAIMLAVYSGKHSKKSKSKHCISVSISLAFTATGNAHMGSHSVTCYPAWVRIPPLPPAEAGTRFSDPGGMQGWVDLHYVKADRLGFEAATCQSQVHRPTAAPRRSSIWLYP